MTPKISLLFVICYLKCLFYISNQMQVYININELGSYATCIMRCDSGVERVVFLREIMLNVYAV